MTNHARNGADQTPTTENDVHCLVCGLRLSTASEWCFGTRDGDHRPSLTDEDRHGPWDKESQRYEDGCKSDGGHDA